jgi:predicted aspartyl protease
MKSLKQFIPNMFMALILAATTTATANNIFNDSTATETSSYVNLFKAGKYLMLKCQLNGKPAYFLIDTGASFTILNSKSAKSYGFDVLERRSQQTTGFGGSESNVKIAIGAELDFEGKGVSMGFLAQDLTKMIRLIQSSTKLRIVGIIGTDLLKRYGCRVDFGNKLLVFS